MLEGGFIGARYSSLRKGEDPTGRFKDELYHEPYIEGKDYSPFIEDGISYAWRKYEFNNHPVKYAIKVYHFTDDQIKELEDYCPCGPCTFFREPKSCTLNYIRGLINSVFMCRCCIGCLTAGSDMANSRNVRLAYDAYNKKL